MLKLEIAGQTIIYRNAPDLTDKVQTLLRERRTDRIAREKEWKALRLQERELERFLGVETPAPSESSIKEASRA